MSTQDRRPLSTRKTIPRAPLTRRYGARDGSVKRGTDTRVLDSPTEAVHPLADSLRTTAEVVAAMHREDAVAVRAVGHVQKQIVALADAVARCIEAGGRIYYVGAGTSGRLGALDAAEWAPTFGTAANLVTALIAGGPRALSHAIEEVEANALAGVEAVRDVGKGDLVCGISASGTTRFVSGALINARAHGATTALITCNPRPRVRDVDHLIIAETGPEIVAGSTRLKAGTATKLILNAVSTAAMFKLGRIVRGRMVNLQPLNPKLRARLAHCMQSRT